MSTKAVKYPKMPTKVKIGTQSWTVIERSSNMDDALSSSAYGYTLVRSSTIIIDADAPPSRKRQTLLHELLHDITLLVFTKKVYLQSCETTHK